MIVRGGTDSRDVVAIAISNGPPRSPARPLARLASVDGHVISSAPPRLVRAPTPHQTQPTHTHARTHPQAMSRPSISRTNLTGSGTGTGSGSGTPASSSPKPGWATASPRKQATTPSSSSSIPTTDLTPFLGLKLQLTLADGSTTTGHLFAHDVSSSLVILETPPSSQVPYPPTAASAPTTKRSQAVNAAQGGSSQQPPTGFKLIKERLIKDVKVLDDDGGDGDANTTPFKLSTVTPVNVAIAEKREMAASRDAALRASRIGVGVTENGQDVFEALSKT